MLRIRTLGASAVALVAGAGMAAAADIYQQQDTVAPIYNPTPAYSWNGPYVGLTGGYGWGGSTISNDGWLGGAYAGYNFQLDNNWVVGLEGDITATSKSGGTSVTIKNPWDATIRGRAGYAYDQFLFYGTGGVAFGKLTASDGTNTESVNKVGWTAGIGAEAALTEKLVGRLELRHTNLGSNTYNTLTVPVTPPTISYNSTDLMAGIGFKF
jgi:outer membrane immunogenic protein